MEERVYKQEPPQEWFLFFCILSEGRERESSAPWRYRGRKKEEEEYIFRLWGKTHWILSLNESSHLALIGICVQGGTE